jgi:hypothetical protein
MNDLSKSEHYTPDRMQRMQQGIPGGFTEPPQETVFEVVTEVRAPASA